MKTQNTQVSTVSAMQNIMQKPSETKTDLKGIKVIRAFRPAEYPKSGKGLFTYTCVILARFQAYPNQGNKPFSIAGFKGYYNTPTAYNYHLKQGNIKDLGNGMAQLTVAGANKFHAGRVQGKDASQEILKDLFNRLFMVLGTGKWNEGKIPEGFSKELVEFSYSIKE